MTDNKTQNKTSRKSVANEKIMSSPTKLTHLNAPHTPETPEPALTSSPL